MKRAAPGRLSFAMLLVSQFAATAGFMFVVPFMPLYVQQLGVADAGMAAAWTGVLNAASATTMILTAPLWGRLADRVGPKAMVLRAAFAGAVVLGLMGLATSPWHLLWLRLIQGTLTGTVAAATLLVSATAPDGKAGERLGALQMFIFSGSAAGPFLGGTFAELVGIRASFGVTASLLAISGIAVFLFVGDAKVEKRADGEDPGGPLPWGLLVPGMLALFVAYVGVQGVMAALPGFVEAVSGTSEGVAGLAGQIVGAGALAAAVGAAAAGRLAARFGTKPVVIGALAIAGLASMAQAGAGSVAELWVMRLVVALFLGGVIPVANLAVRESVPPARQGAAFGVSASVNAVGFGFGPLAAGLLAAGFGFGAPFLGAGALAAGAALALVALPFGKSRERVEIPRCGRLVQGMKAVRALKTALIHLVNK